MKQEEQTTIYVGMVAGEDGSDMFATRVLEVTEEPMANVDQAGWFTLKMIEWANEKVVKVTWAEDDGNPNKAPSKRQELLGVNDPEVKIRVPIFSYFFHLRSFHSKASASEWNRTRALELQQEHEEESDNERH